MTELGKMAQIITERDVMTKILEQYRKSPWLWDPSNKYYFNKPVRHKTYENMLDLWLKLEPFGSVETLKKKLEYVRAAYRRELKKVANAVGNSEYKPKLWYYNLLTFLNMRHASTKDSTDDDDYNDDDDKPSTPIPPPKKKRKTQPAHSTENQETEMQQSKTQSEANTNTNTEEDYVTVYGKAIASQLKELDDEVRYEAERLISDVIYRARTGKLPKFTPQAVDNLVIPDTGPSWYDIPPEQSNDEQSCYVLAAVEPSAEIIKTEVEEEEPVAQIIIKRELEEDLSAEIIKTELDEEYVTQLL